MQVVELYAIFRSLRVGAFQFLQFAFKDLGLLFRPFLFRRLFRQFLDILLVGRASQFLLDGTQLLVEVILTLLLVHVDAHLALDLLFQLHHLLLLGQHAQQVGGHLVQRAGLKQHLFGRHVGFHVAGHEVHQKHRVFDALDGEASLLGQVARTAYNLDGQIFDRLHQGIEFLGMRNLFCYGIRNHSGLQIRLSLGLLHHLEAAFALDDDGRVAIGHLQGLDDLSRRAHLIQVFHGRVFHIGIGLRNDANGLAFLIVFLHKLDGLVASHSDGDDNARIEHRVAQRQNRQFLRHLFVLAETLILDGQHGDEVAIGVHHIGKQFCI